jgi:hypothetical protein
MLVPRPTGRRRPLLPLSSLVVPALAGLGGIAFLAWRPGVARSMLGSPRALAFSVVVAVLALGLGWLLPRLGRGALATAAAQAVPVLLAFVVTVLPAFRDVTVVEAFPPDRAGRPAVTGQAKLQGIDHRASGTALLLERPDGSYVVRLQGIDIEPGPDYHVHLVPGADQQDPGGGVRLDNLRGNRGSQNYDVPAGTDVQTPVTVLVWCRAFAVPVAAATIP